MALTKPTFYISMIAIVLLIFTTLGIAGTSLINSDRITLSDKSTDYINQINGISSGSGFDAISNTSIGDSTDTKILNSEDNTSVSTLQDFLATLNIKKERFKLPLTYFKLVYNIPASIIISIGLPASDFQHAINIIGYVILISLTIMFWTKFINT